MKKDVFVLLTVLATLVQPVLAEQSSKTALVNQFAAPVLLQNNRINYQQHELKQQQLAAQQVTAHTATARTETDSTPRQLHSTQSADSADASLHQVFESFSLGQGIGINGLLQGDYNGDGVPELVLANPMSVVFADATQNQFGLRQQLPFTSGIGKLVYFHDLSTDGHFAFFSSENKLLKLDLIGRKVVASLDIDNLSSYQLLGTADQQSKMLLATSYSGELLVINPLTLQIVRSQSGFASAIAAIGAFTAADQVQVFFKNGQIYNFADNSLSLEKTIITEDAAFTYAVDVNGDGLAEILSAQSWYSIKLISPLTEEVLWSKQSDLDIDALILADVNKDGRLDGVYGDGQWGSLYAFDLQNGEDFWTISNPEHGVTNIIIADLDNDGSQDIGWGAGYSSSGADYFFIHDLTSKQLKWQSEDIGFPAAAVTLVDIDQDGDLDAVTASLDSNSGYDGGVIQVFDIQSNTRLWHGVAANNWGNTMNVLVADLDNNTTTELVIGSSQIYTGLVRVLNAKDGSERFSKLLGDGDNISGLLVTDLNNDGISEIIVGNGAEHTGSEGAFFTVLSGLNGDVLKQSPSLGFHWQGLTDLHAVLHQDGYSVYGLLGNNLYQYNYSNNTVQQLTNSAQYLQLTAVLAGGESQLVAGDNNGNLLVLSTSGDVTSSIQVCQSQITGLSSSVADTVLYSCGDSFGEFNLATN
ncbi:MAG TPA: VCBS repeat-containing protein, partial [Rheinheimera sp.]|nr:VCBS repeat-containing protein [Rheinheimera sp.]